MPPAVNDVFGRTDTGFGGAFTSSLASFSLSSTGGDINKLLVTNLQANYNQPINRIYELASNRAFFVVGRPEGTGNFGSVFGPKPVTELAYKQLADPCNNNTISLNFQGQASCDSNGARFSPQFGRRLVGVVLQTLGFSVNAQDMLINENVGFLYAALEKA